jgi:ubiquinone/menaquinone biosynthesis C-methylase UbiE
MKAREYYNSIAGGYDELYGPEQLAKWNAAKKLMKFSKNDVVLDVGCGTGLITVEIAKLVKSVTGIDISEVMINNAKPADNVTYIVADALMLPFPDKSFDKVVSFTVLQDIEDKETALKAMKRVCKGEILITIQKRNKSIDEIKSLLSKHFKIKKFSEEEKDFIFVLES